MMSRRPMPHLVPGALDRHPAVTRDMTADEAQMARAVACCSMLKASEHRGTLRLLHARSLTDNRFITPREASLLRACVVAFKSKLAPEIVALAGETK